MHHQAHEGRATQHSAPSISVAGAARANPARRERDLGLQDPRHPAAKDCQEQLSATQRRTLNKEYGVPNSPDPSEFGIEDLVSPAVMGLVAGVIAGACILGALHLLGAGRRIIPTVPIIIGLVVVASVAGAWLGLRAHEPALGAAAGGLAEGYLAVRIA